MKKRVLCVVMVLLMVILLCSCAREDPLQAQYTFKGRFPYPEMDPAVSVTVDNTTPYQELITKEVDIHYFVETYIKDGGYGYTIYGYMGHLAADIGVECLRETEAGALYSVHTVKQGGLLYIFYHNTGYYTDKPLVQRPVRRWFYVPKRLSSKDFDKVDTISEEIKVDPSTQIFKNIHESTDPELQESKIATWHYLTDGVLEAGYEEINGEWALIAKELADDFYVCDATAGYSEPYNGRILDMDWVK